jgi:hypothetical protein
VRDLGDVATAEREPADRREGGQRAQREHIDGRRHRPVQDLLGRQVVRRPHRGPGPRRRGRRQRSGDPEIDHPRAVLGEEHVGRLEVAVDDVSRVDRLERLGDAGDQPEHHRLGHRAVAVDDVLDRGTGHVRGHQPRRGGGRVGVDQLRRVQPADSPRGLDLLLEAEAKVLVVAEV